MNRSTPPLIVSGCAGLIFGMLVGRFAKQKSEPEPATTMQFHGKVNIIDDTNKFGSYWVEMGGTNYVFYYTVTNQQLFMHLDRYILPGERTK